MGPEAGAGWITSNGEESDYPESYGKSVEAEAVETIDMTVIGSVDETFVETVDETVSAAEAVETVDPINTFDPLSEANEIVETAEPEGGDPRCRTRSTH